MAKKKNNTKLIVFIIVIAIVGVAVVAAIFFNNRPKPVKVTITKVAERTITQTVSAIGKIEPETEVKISSETSGEIIFLGPKEGDTVKYNQIVVRIKPDIIETQLEQFRAAADASKMEINSRKAEKDQAQSELQRITELYQKQFVSKQEFERAKTTYDQMLSAYRAALSRYDQALATLKQFQRSADRTTIFAPITGVVTKLDVEKGEKVVGTAQMQGTEIMRISDLAVMNAVVDVDENDIVLVKVGDTTRVEIDAFPDRIFIGKVFEIGHSAKVNQLGTQDQVTNFEVKIRILDKEGRLRPGMSCNVEIETETRSNVLAVPLQSVTIRDSSLSQSDESDGRLQKVKKDDDKKLKRPPSVVFVKDGSKAKLVRVETGISDKGYIQVLSGLSKGQEVISGSFMAISKQLSDGSDITIEKPKKWSKKK